MSELARVIPIRKPDLTDVEEDAIIAEALSILERRMRRSGVLLNSPEVVSAWLRLKVGSLQDRRINLRVHPLLQDAGRRPQNCKEKCCYAISVDGRWLHTGDGRLTVLKGMEAVNRFIRLIKMPVFESGEPAKIEVDCGKTAYCMVAARNAGLQGFA